MAKMEKTIVINAPAEKIFNYIADPANLPSIWPSMEQIKDIVSLPSGGTSFKWVYKMAGMRIDGASDTIGFIANQRIITKSKSGIENTFTWNFQAEAGGTQVNLEVEYTVPVPVLGKLAEVVIIRQNDHEAEVLLANLKAKMEV
jgi:uncharacterized membrane protein